MLQVHFYRWCKIVKSQLEGPVWMTCATLTDKLSKAHVLVFDDLDIYKMFYFASPQKKTAMVRSALRSLCKPPAGMVEVEAWKPCKAKGRPHWLYRIIDTRHRT